MTLDKPSGQRTSARLRRIKAVDKERCKNCVIVNTKKVLMAVSSHAHPLSKDEVQYSMTESMTDDAKGISDHLACSASADGEVFGRTRCVVLDGTATIRGSSSLLGLLATFSPSKYLELKRSKQTLVSEVYQVWAVLKNLEANPGDSYLPQSAEEQTNPDKRPLINTTDRHHYPKELFFAEASVSQPSLRESTPYLKSFPDAKPSPQRIISQSASEEPLVGPAVRTTDHFSYFQSLRRVSSTTGRAQSASAIGEQLVSSCQALRPILEPPSPSRLENHPPLFQPISSPPSSALTLPQPDRQSRGEASPYFRSKPTIERKENRYIASSVELAIPQEPRLFCVINQTHPAAACHQTVDKDRQSKTSVSDNSDYTKSRPPSEETLIAQGSYIADQNSAYYAQLYKVGNPFTHSSPKLQEITARVFDHPLASSVQPLLLRRAVLGADLPSLFSPFDNAPAERRREWKNTERKLTGPNFFSELPSIPNPPVLVDVNSFLEPVDDISCQSTFSQTCTIYHNCDYRTRFAPHITPTNLDSPFSVSDSLRISSSEKQRPGPSSTHCRVQNRTTETEFIFSTDVSCSRGFGLQSTAEIEIGSLQSSEVQPQANTSQGRFYTPQQPLFCQHLENSPIESPEYLQGRKLNSNATGSHLGELDPTEAPFPSYTDYTPDTSFFLTQADQICLQQDYQHNYRQHLVHLRRSFSGSRLPLDLKDTRFIKRHSGDEKKSFPGLILIKPRPSSEPFLCGDYPVYTIAKDQSLSVTASGKRILERYCIAHKQSASRSVFALESLGLTSSSSIQEPLAHLPNLSLGSVLKEVPRSASNSPVLQRCSSDPPRDAKQHLPVHALKKKKPFAKLKEWKSLLSWNQSDDNKSEEHFEADSETISEKDLYKGKRALDSQPHFPGATVDPNRSEIEGGSTNTGKEQANSHKNSSWLLIDKLSFPPVPTKSPLKLVKLDGENESRRNQTLVHCGSRFNDTPPARYPVEVDDIAVLSVLRADNIPTDSPTFINSGQLPFPIKIPATESCSSSTQLSTGLNTIGDLPIITLSSLPSTSPALTISSREQGSIYFLNNDNIAKAATPTQLSRMENKLQIRPAEFSSVKAKAVEDAKQMLATVIEAANKSGQDPPKYALLELIGKGSFGRVYKGKDMTSAAIVAVKIIDIDESDTVNPRIADSYSDFLKEVNALKILSENKARNINHVIEALPVGQSMWMISEYCGGGSIATLMRPNAPNGLQEKWIIPILREVAEAVKWVHQAGIIHRDIKCANVLITEGSSVQLCDFGVAGIIETKLDKRSTVIGTPHWMAPELFSSTPSYGKEVDIWAFGSMVFEIATGYPPNAANRIPFERLGTHLKHNAPRLEGGNYSNELRNLVAYCLEELPSVRPTIEQVQKHPYIHNTTSRYPTSSLSHLVRAFKVWEDHGGSRKSLFMLGGAQGPSESSSATYDDEWNFSTTAAFDQEVSRDSNPQDVYEVYGTSVLGFSEETSRPSQQAKPSRRRPPPEALARLPAPLEKIFDPNTLSNYDENSRNHYGRLMPPPTSDLPLRDDSAQTSIRDTMIDLGGHDSETGISNFPDMETIKADRRGHRDEIEDEYGPLHDFSRPALSDPADVNPNRRTQDWKFPTMAPASADPEISRFPNSYEIQRPAVTPGSGSRPALVHHPTEPPSGFGGMLGATTSAMERMSIRESLIDLDMSLPDVIPDIARPSTANSDVDSTASAAGEHLTSGNPFEFERHASMYLPALFEPAGPSTYASKGTSAPLQPGNSLQEIVDLSDFSASDIEPSTRNMQNMYSRYDGASDSNYLSMAPPPPHGRAIGTTMAEPPKNPANTVYSMNRFPELPPPPSAAALGGLVSRDDMRHEILRQLTGMTDQLSAFKDVYESPMLVNRAGQSRRTGRASDGNGGGQ